MDTMDPKKKKIYIGIISGSLLLTVGVLWWGFGGGGGATPVATTPDQSLPIDSAIPSEDPGTGTSAGGQVPQVSTPNTYGAPAVFPNRTTFDLAIFNSSEFTGLADYAPLTTSPTDIGRENPFLAP